eukprot:363107-Chlamydomonas_euryale.AAC.10
MRGALRLLARERRRLVNPCVNGLAPREIVRHDRLVPELKRGHPTVRALHAGAQRVQRRRCGAGKGAAKPGRRKWTPGAAGAHRRGRQAPWQAPAEVSVACGRRCKLRGRRCPEPL